MIAGGGYVQRRDALLSLYSMIAVDPDDPLALHREDLRLGERRLWRDLLEH